MTYQPSPQAEAFVAYVNSHLRDPAVRAALRNAPARPFEAQVLVAPFNNSERISEDVLIAIATWIARFDPAGAGGKGNLGASCGRARGRSSSIETRLLAICRQRRAQALEQIPRLLAATREVPHWPTLIDDLVWWDRSRDRIARRWLSAFYGADLDAEAADGGTVEITIDQAESQETDTP
jgi:CRISPR type I-E-associated protein CasB/Cse2